MNDKQRIWRLISRRMAGEASTEELRELQNLLQNNPGIQYFMETLMELWRPAENLNEQELEQLYERHTQRLEQKMQEKERAGQSAGRKRLMKSNPFKFVYNGAVLNNYIKVIIRNLSRYKGFSFVNVSGLAIGMASAILILLWIQNEISYDRFHEKKDRIYILYNRAMFDGKLECWPGMPMVMAPVLKANYPQVEEVSRLNGVGPFVLNVGDRHFEANGMIVDPGFLKIFSFPLVKGRIEQALNSPRSMVITEKFAKKIFPGEDAMGQVIRIDSNAYFKIEGIVKTLPNNTSFDFEYLLPWSYMKEVHWDKQSWTDNSIRTFVLLKPGVSETAANDRFRDIIKAHAGNVTNEVFLHPLAKWQLYSRFENGKIVGGGIENVRLFGAIAGFILLIACINYMNLSTARNVKSAKEVGIRKVVGAGKVSIICRFLGESIMISLLSGLIAVVVVQLTIKEFNWLTWKQLNVPYDNPYFWFAIIGFVLITGLIAGSYPAFYLSTYKPISVLKGTFRTAYNLVSIRKILVVFQFCFAIVFIICTVVIYRQINYASKRDPGYNRDHLAFAYINGNVNSKYQLIKRDLLTSGAVTAVTRSNSPITYIWSGDDNYKWTGSDPRKKIYFNEFHVDNDFLETMGLKLVSGRTINTAVYPTDSTSILLSESAVTVMGLKNPIGQIVESPQGNWTVVGIVKDFVPGSPFFSVQPMIIQGPKNWFGAVTFRLNPNYSLSDNMKKVEYIFKKYNPEYPFNYRFVDEADAEKFEGERRTGIQSALFGGLAILISCLGLFALSAYMAESRIKEIGVRKVLGATVFNVWQLLSRDFVLLVIIAFVIASPIAYYFMHNWILNYNYRTDISWWIFAVAGAGALVITLLTVSFQAIKAAVANPAHSLRTE
ncbi:MAG TPA: ABC transporter permease [Puia sp.]